MLNPTADEIHAVIAALHANLTPEQMLTGDEEWNTRAATAIIRALDAVRNTAPASPAAVRAALATALDLGYLKDKVTGSTDDFEAYARAVLRRAPPAPVPAPAPAPGTSTAEEIHEVIAKTQAALNATVQQPPHYVVVVGADRLNAASPPPVEETIASIPSRQVWLEGLRHRARCYVAVEGSLNTAHLDLANDLTAQIDATVRPTPAVFPAEMTPVTAWEKELASVSPCAQCEGYGGRAIALDGTSTPTKCEQCGVISPQSDCDQLNSWLALKVAAKTAKEATVAAASAAATSAAYTELLMAVSNKYEKETRHQTALRYIRENGRTIARESMAKNALQALIDAGVTLDPEEARELLAALPARGRHPAKAVPQEPPANHAVVQAERDQFFMDRYNLEVRLRKMEDKCTRLMVVVNAAKALRASHGLTFQHPSFSSRLAYEGAQKIMDEVLATLLTTDPQ